MVFKYHAWLLFILAPACFVLAWWLVQRYSPYARGSGIPQVMAAIQISSPKTNYLVDKLLGFRIIFIKVLSSLIMAIGGGAIGREGVTIHIAASIYKIVYQVLPKWWPKIAKRNMMVTGAAAGLAAAFNTPLGGIVFAIEELTKTHFSYYKTAIFSSVIIAGLSAEALLALFIPRLSKNRRSFGIHIFWRCIGCFDCRPFRKRDVKINTFYFCMGKQSLNSNTTMLFM